MHIQELDLQIEKALRAHANMGNGNMFSPLHDVLKTMLQGKSHGNKGKTNEKILAKHI